MFESQTDMYFFFIFYQRELMNKSCISMAIIRARIDLVGIAAECEYAAMCKMPYILRLRAITMTVQQNIGI